MNTFQEIVARAYAGGEYAHLIGDQQWFLKLPQIGDTLFQFAMIELADQEGCDSLEEAIRRLEQAKDDLDEVIVSMRRKHTGPFWHEHNPWKDRVVYVPIEELAEASVHLDDRVMIAPNVVVPVTKETILERWRSAGDKLDAYILPQPDDTFLMGVRYGRNPQDYRAPLGAHEKLKALFEKYGRR